MYQTFLSMYTTPCSMFFLLLPYVQSVSIKSIKIYFSTCNTYMFLQFWGISIQFCYVQNQNAHKNI